VNVPIVELKSQYLDLRAEIDAAIQQVLDASWYVLGEQGRRFEEEFADYLGLPHAVGVGSGTEALHLALLACGIQPGDEVITTPMTAAATACAIRFANATPVFADVDATTLTLDPQDVERRLTSRTRAILPVHLYGHPADLDPLLALAHRHDLRLIEDCAQAHGTRYRGRLVGTFGDAAAFSFYPSKNLGAYGDAGAVVCRDAAMAQQLRMLRNYGEEKRYFHSIEGFNSRLDEIQAAILRAKLPYLNRWNDRRRAIATHYQHRVHHSVVDLPVERPDAGHTYHLYVVRTPHREALREHLALRGIGSQIHYPVPLHRQQAFAHLGQGAGDCPIAEEAAERVLSLPMFPELTDEQVAHVVDGMNSFAPPGTQAK
jgi:dTDP-4-amino-4,6-dideoxygalactose transaminase